MPIIVNYEKCCWQDGKCSSCSCGGACVGCVEICASQAITRENVVKIDESACTECGACIAACKHGALSMG